MIAVTLYTWLLLLNCALEQEAVRPWRGSFRNLQGPTSRILCLETGQDVEVVVIVRKQGNQLRLVFFFKAIEGSWVHLKNF